MEGEGQMNGPCRFMIIHVTWLMNKVTCIMMCLRNVMGIINNHYTKFN